MTRVGDKLHVRGERRIKDDLLRLAVINECLESEDWLYNVFASLGKSEKF